MRPTPQTLNKGKKNMDLGIVIAKLNSKFIESKKELKKDDIGDLQVD
jgi:hypothetical protein